MCIRDKLVRMGEAPDTVFCVGGLGDENIRTLPKMSREELCKSTGFDLMQPFALVTYHPETAPDAGSPAVQVQALCDACLLYTSWFYNALNFANISKYNIWIAQYRDTLSFSYKHNIWQYTGSGSVKGISKPVDMNIG